MIKQEPLYIQVKESISKKINLGDYLPGEMIPSERTMAEEYGVHRETIKRAISLLVEEGLLHSVQGKGTFVTKRKAKIYEESYNSGNNVGITAKLKLQGMIPSNKIIAINTTTSLPRIAKKLKIRTDSEIFALYRLRYADGVPFTVEYAYFPNDILDDDVYKFDFSEVSFYDYLNSKNHLPIEFGRVLKVVLCPEREAEFLDIQTGTPVYLFEDMGRDSDGRIVEFIRTYTRTDQVKLTFNSYKKMDDR